MHCQLSLWDMYKAGKLCFINNTRSKSCLSAVKRHVSVYHSRPEAGHTWGHTDEESEYSLHALNLPIVGERIKIQSRICQVYKCERTKYGNSREKGVF